MRGNLLVCGALCLASCGSEQRTDNAESASPSPVALAGMPTGAAAILPERLHGRNWGEEVEARLLYDIAGQELAASVLRGKSEDGLVRKLTGDPDIARAAEIYDKSRTALAALSTDAVPTYLLLHRIDRDRTMRAWLVGPDGVIAYGSGEAPYKGLVGLTKGLGVTRLAGTRAGRPEGTPAPTEDAVRAAEREDRTPASIEARKTSLVAARDELLPASIAEALGRTGGRVVVVAAEDTGTAPYAAMPLANGVAARNWSFVVLPDIAALAEADPGFDFSALDIRKAVIAGNPDLKGDPKYDWADLPGAQAEAELVARELALPAGDVLLGKAVTHDAVRAAIRQKKGEGLVYIASHAMADPRNPLTRGFIAMTGEHYYAGWIRAEKFPEWKKHPPLVVVSACQTALGRTLDAGGFGVTQAWEAAGAGQVVSSLWNVSDRATYYLMSRFVQGLKNGVPPELAMRQAQLDTMDYRDSKGAQPYRDDPKMWASFTVYGKPSILEKATAKTTG